MRFIILFAILLVAAACDKSLTFLAGEDWQSGNAYTKVHWSGSGADASSTTYVVARNQAEWENLWQRVAAPAPGVLPPGKMGVAVLLGQRPNPGYRVEITDAKKEFLFGQVETFKVKYRTFEPNPAMAYAEVIASPWAIRLADFSDRNVDFDSVN
jgi:hypothetical protein